jgi:O-antigen/teichoic acid export membrane protein
MIAQHILSFVRKSIHHKGLQMHSKNISWMFIARIGAMAMSFLATAFIARHLGPSNYGQLSYAISFSSLFVFIASLGLDQILHRDIVKDPSRTNELIGSAVALRMTSSIIAAIITTLAAFFYSQEDVSLVLIFIISLSPLFGAFQLIGYQFQANHESKYPSILSLILIFILNSIKVLLVFFGFGIIYLSMVIVLEPILYSLGYLYIKNKLYRDVPFLRVNVLLVKRLARDSTPLMFAAAFYALYMRIDQVMIKNMIDAHAVGIYDAAVRISELSYFVPSTILVALFPAIIRAKSVSNAFYFTRLRQLGVLIFTTTGVLAAITALFSKQLVGLIYGSAFTESLPILTIYTWSNIGAALTMYFQQILITENKSKIIVYSVFIGASVNIALNYVLIPTHGSEGAALATLVSYTIPSISLFFFKETRSILMNIIK